MEPKHHPVAIPKFISQTSSFPFKMLIFQGVPSLKLAANAPENRPSQKETSIPTIHFQVQAVSFGEGNSFHSEKCKTRGGSKSGSFGEGIGYHEGDKKNHGSKGELGGGNSNIFHFHPCFVKIHIFANNTTVFLRWCETTNYRTFAWFCSWRWFFSAILTTKKSTERRENCQKWEVWFRWMCSLFEWVDFQVPLNVLGYPTPDGPLQGEDAQCGEGRGNIPGSLTAFRWREGLFYLDVPGS